MKIRQITTVAREGYHYKSCENYIDSTHTKTKVQGVGDLVALNPYVFSPGILRTHYQGSA
jgi:hypothetical protein